MSLKVSSKVFPHFPQVEIILHSVSTLCSTRSFSVLFLKVALLRTETNPRLYIYKGQMTRLSHIINCSNNKLALTTILFLIKIFSYLIIVIKIISQPIIWHLEALIIYYYKMFIRLSTYFRIIKFYYSKHYFLQLDSNFLSLITIKLISGAF